MPRTVYVDGGGGPALAPGRYLAVCCDVIDLGTQASPWGDRRQIKLVFEVATPTGRRIISRRYTASIHPQAKLTQHLEAWRGRPFTDAERARFDLGTLIGITAELQVGHRLGAKGSTYAEIQAILPPPRGRDGKPEYRRLAIEAYTPPPDPADEPEPTPAMDDEPATTIDDDDIPF